MDNNDQNQSSEQPEPPRTQAAQYVRMSTEDQSNVIRDYAAKRGYEITCTYADDGKNSPVKDHGDD